MNSTAARPWLVKKFHAKKQQKAFRSRFFFTNSSHKATGLLYRTWFFTKFVHFGHSGSKEFIDISAELCWSLKKWTWPHFGKALSLPKYKILKQTINIFRKKNHRNYTYAVETCLSWSKSDLFPTNIIGTFSVALTLQIWFLILFISVNVCFDEIEKTKMNPCPFRMYKSLIDANCSVPAVSKISKVAGLPSTSISFR